MNKADIKARIETILQQLDGQTDAQSALSALHCELDRLISTSAISESPAPQRPETVSAAPVYIGFTGEIVAFTGRLHSATRKGAVDIVQRGGGKAYFKMPSSTTLLVKGDAPGAIKLEKAAEWNVPIIDEAEFKRRSLLTAPVNIPAIHNLSPTEQRIKNVSLDDFLALCAI